MEAKLFAENEVGKYLFDVIFHGPSYDGIMEIDALAKEIQGLEDVLRIGIHALKKSKRIEFSNEDLVLYVSAFEKSSFKKRILVFNKKTGEFQPLIELSVLILLALQTIALYKPEEIKSISPELMSSIRDTVAVEILQDEKFIKSAAAIVQSVSSEADSCKLIAPNNEEVTINPEISKKMQELAKPAEEVVEGEYYEIIQGRISKVDLDAFKRHIGFKYNGEGATIEATFKEKPDYEELKSLLGAWVELKGQVSYIGVSRSHIDIQEYSLISQKQLGLPNVSE